MKLSIKRYPKEQALSITDGEGFWWISYQEFTTWMNLRRKDRRLRKETMRAAIAMDMGVVGYTKALEEGTIQ